jgi:hypothetical protein
VDPSFSAIPWPCGPPRTGDADEAAAAFAETRHAVYEKILGEVHRVFEESSARIPRVDVRAYNRRGPNGANVCALATSGMSDLPMSIPAGLDAPRRVEAFSYRIRLSGSLGSTVLGNFPVIG